MKWIFISVIMGTIAYLAQILMNFLEKYRDSNGKIEQSLIDLNRIEGQLEEAERARVEAESRANMLEEESLLYEQQISEIQQKFNSRLPRPETAESAES